MNNPTWIKITILFSQNISLTYSAMEFVKRFEERFKVQHLYFSRYVDLAKNTIEISALTPARRASISRFLKSRIGVLSVKMEDRGTGSMAHAHAYRAVGAMEPWERDKQDGWHEFLDVIHWMCNMRGYDYLREIRFYGYAGYTFANQLAIQNEQAMAKMKQSSIIAMVKNLEEKDQEQKAAKSSSARAPQSKRSESAGAASRKARG